MSMVSKMLVNKAVGFLRSPQGQQVAAQLRTRLDTPANRDRLARAAQVVAERAQTVAQRSAGERAATGVEPGGVPGGVSGEVPPWGTPPTGAGRGARRWPPR